MDSGGGRRDRPAGLPHSETHGSRAACASPWNIAACRVLRRRPPPRHPPCARTAWPQKPRGHAPDVLSDAPARGHAGSSPRGRLLLHLVAFLSLPTMYAGLSDLSFQLSIAFTSGCQRAGPRRTARKGVVGAPGLEPGTSSLSEKRSNQLSYAPLGGGAEGTRTHDILLAKQALYQLSYGPNSPSGILRLPWEASSAIPCGRRLAALAGDSSLKRR